MRLPSQFPARIASAARPALAQVRQRYSLTGNSSQPYRAARPRPSTTVLQNSQQRCYGFVGQASAGAGLQGRQKVHRLKTGAQDESCFVTQ